MLEWTVSREEEGQRFDKFLRRRLPMAPASFLYKMLRKKNITLRGKKADGSEKVGEGDRIQLFLSEETIRKFSAPEGTGKADSSREEERAFRILSSRMGKQPILYEDEDFLILVKPAGVLSQKAKPEDVSVNEWLRGFLLHRGERFTVYRPSVCNRLDRGTGGILLCAKSLRGSRALTEVIRNRSIRKTYRMVVRGQVREPGRIEKALVKDARENRVLVNAREEPQPGEGSGGGPGAAKTGLSERSENRAGRIREALTIYRPVKTGKQNTLVEADLITGRSHQLRVHMASIGHPIVGDVKYGPGKPDPAAGQGRQAAGTGISSGRGSGHQPAADRETRRSLRGQLLWCTEVAFPSFREDPSLPRELASLAGRTFQSPPPPWWEEYYRD